MTRHHALTQSDASRIVGLPSVVAIALGKRILPVNFAGPSGPASLFQQIRRSLKTWPS